MASLKLSYLPSRKYLEGRETVSMLGCNGSLPRSNCAMLQTIMDPFSTYQVGYHERRLFQMESPFPGVFPVWWNGQLKTDWSGGRDVWQISTNEQRPDRSQSRRMAIGQLISATWQEGETVAGKFGTQGLVPAGRSPGPTNPLDRRMRSQHRFASKAAGVIGQGATVSEPSEQTVAGVAKESKPKLEEVLGMNLPEVYTVFNISDFCISPHVSVGLHGRRDELLYEGVVQNPSSPLRGMRVVLRQMTGPRALRWGQRALQVTPRLLRGEEWHPPYTTRLHGFIPPHAEDNASLTLVHGYYGSYSLHQWLLCSDWLPLLEARLALDEEAARRVGDERVGGPQLSRQLRLIRMVLRDVLIGVNYVHSRGMAHLDLRLQNAHISAADRHVKVGMLGQAVDFPQEASPGVPLRQRMIASDIRSVGVMMAQMVLRELMDPSMAALFKNFLKQGHDPSCLREYLHPMLCGDHPLGSPGMQILDLDGGAGWNLLAAMLDPRPANRISCQDALRHPFLCGPRWRRGESSPSMLRWAVGSAAVRISEEFIYLQDQRQRLQQLIGLLEKMKDSITIQDWERLGSGTWRLLYHTGRHIGPTLRQASPAVRIGHVQLTLEPRAHGEAPSTAQMKVGVSFTVMPEEGDWPADKSGIKGLLKLQCKHVVVTPGARMYVSAPEDDQRGGNGEARLGQGRGGGRDGRRVLGRAQDRKRPRDGGLGQGQGMAGQAGSEGQRISIPVLGLAVEDVELGLELDYPGDASKIVQRVLREVRLQIPREMFDLSALACVSSLDGRFLVLKGVTGASLLFARSPRR